MTELKQEFEALKASLDTCEGGIFARIEDIAESVKPATEVLKVLQWSLPAGQQQPETR